MPGVDETEAPATPELTTEAPAQAASAPSSGAVDTGRRVDPSLLQRDGRNDHRNTVRRPDPRRDDAPPAHAAMHDAAPSDTTPKEAGHAERAPREAREQRGKRREPEVFRKGGGPRRDLLPAR